MARGKIAMTPAARYAKRTKGLRKKASELSTLCGVPVALVCARGDRAGASLVWESEEGVLDRYRAAAVPPKTRAQHTHRGYLEAELGKGKAKLARARHGGALADWDAALNDMTLDEVRGVLQTIDAVLRAAGDRMAALGLPADGRIELEQVAVPDDDDASDNNNAAVAPQQLGLEDMDMGGDLLEQFLLQPGYGLERVVGGSYDVGAVEETQAPGDYANNADCGWPDLTMCYHPEFVDGTLAPGHGCSARTRRYRTIRYVSPLAPEHYSAQVVTSGTLPLALEYPMGMDQNFSNSTAQWQAEDQFQHSDANSSMDDNYTYLDNSYAAHWQAEDQFQHSDANSTMDENYTYLDNSCTAQWQAEEFQPSNTNSSMDENYTYLDSSYAAHWQAEDQFQHSDAGTGRYQYQCSDPGTHSSSQVFNYRY